MTEINTERAFRPSNYGWTIFTNDIPERLETHSHDSLRRPLASPVTFTIPARREWFGQHRRSGTILGPFGSREEAQAAVDADDAANRQNGPHGFTWKSSCASSRERYSHHAY